MRSAMALCLIAVFVSLSAASAAVTPVPIEGKLLVAGWDQSDAFYSYFMAGSSDAVTATPWKVDAPDLSPDMTKVTYNVRTASGLFHAETGDIWVSDMDGGDPVNLTALAGLGGVNCRPTWSPDGRLIAFQHAAPVVGQSTCDAGWQVYLIAADGTGLHQWLSDPGGSTFLPSWSPDGRWLLADSWELGCVVGEVTGASVHALTGVVSEDARWSRDGSKLVYSTTVAATVSGETGVWRQLILADADGSNPQVLVEQFVKDSDVAAHIAAYDLQPSERDWVVTIRGEVGPKWPKWSPRGNQVAFPAALPFDPDGPMLWYQMEVWLYDLDTEEIIRLTEDQNWDYWLSWAGPNTTSASPAVTVYDNSITFSEVDEDGWTYIAWRDDVPALPALYLPVGNTYEIRTTAVTTGPATVALTCDTGGLPAAAVSHVNLLRYDGGAAEWLDITTSRGTTAGVVQGQTQTLGLMRLAWPLPESDFSDVSDLESDPFWALWEIQAASDAGIVQGYPGGTYHPAEAVSRAQMAVYIARALAGGDAGVPATPSTVSFPDDVPADHWAYRYVEYAVDAGVVQGYDATHYRPDTIVTRDQMAVFVARAKGWISLGEAMDTAPEVFPDVPAGFWSGTAVEACVAHGVVNGYSDGTYRPEREVSRDQMAVYVARAFGLL